MGLYDYFYGQTLQQGESTNPFLDPETGAAVLPSLQPGGQPVTSTSPMQTYAAADPSLPGTKEHNLWNAEHGIGNDTGTNCPVGYVWNSQLNQCVPISGGGDGSSSQSPSEQRIASNRNYLDNIIDAGGGLIADVPHVLDSSQSSSEYNQNFADNYNAALAHSNANPTGQTTGVPLYQQGFDFNPEPTWIEEVLGGTQLGQVYQGLTGKPLGEGDDIESLLPPTSSSSSDKDDGPSAAQQAASAAASSGDWGGPSSAPSAPAPTSYDFGSAYNYNQGGMVDPGLAMALQSTAGYNKGGMVHMQNGGITPGQPMAPSGMREGPQHDTTQAMLTPGEMVLDEDSTAAINQMAPGFLDSLNNWEPKDGPGMLMSLFDSLDDVTMSKTDKMGNKITVKSPEGTRMKTMFG